MITEMELNKAIEEASLSGGGFTEYETLAEAIANAKNTVRVLAYEITGSYPGFAIADCPVIFMNGEIETPVNFEYYGGDSDKFYIRMTKQAGNMWTKYYAYYSTNRTSYANWKYYAN